MLFWCLILAASASAQSLPPELRAHGGTVSEWAIVQAEVRRLADANEVSERALQTIAQRLGVRQGEHGRVDIGALLVALERSVGRLEALERGLAELAIASDSADVTGAIAGVRRAVARGNLDEADARLAAAFADFAALDARVGQVQSRRRSAASSLALRSELARAEGNYRGAATLLGQAAELETIDYVRWLYRLGQASALGDGDAFADRAALREALTILREEALPLTSEGSPARRMTIENSISLLREIGDVEDDATLLREAVTLARGLAASANRTSEPEIWAHAQWRLGNTLRALGEHTNDRAVLRDAAVAYRNAMEVFTRMTHADDWALLQNNLGNVLRIQAELGDRSTLEAAISAYRAALEAANRQARPDTWAAARANLAIAQRLVGDRASVEASVVGLREVIEARDPARQAGPWAYGHYQLALSLEAGISEHPEWRNEALSSARTAVEVYTRLAISEEAQARALLLRLEAR